MTEVAIRIDDDQLQAFLRRASDNLRRLVDEVADEVARQVAQEAGKRSHRLGRTWEVTGVGPEHREVIAPEFFAHFLYSGTAPHGPRTKTRLMFSVSGQTVFARQVSGISADPFDERGARAAENRVDDIVERLISGGM